LGKELGIIMGQNLLSGICFATGSKLANSFLGSRARIISIRGEKVA